MHSAKAGPSNSKRSSGLPCLRWPLQKLRRLQLLLLLATVLLPVAEHRGRRKQQRRVQ